ncbi:MAG TPA: hypothetical protein PLO61_10365 [Fimbriimonadaceae bacterium]|nr:hypothetical protein [Fimbriimonadaceae bacterium]HRJ34003.1 hypothetical protein [Fimbriimonadaceae bacterium]
MRIISLILLFVLASLSLAELPNSSYYRLQEGAPEYFDLKILKVEVRRSTGWEVLTWEAEILEVFRTSSNAKVGQKIRLKHEQVAAGSMAPGPARAPQLRVGSVVPAFLRKSKEGHFELAKYGRSFEIMARPDRPGSGG